MICWTSSHSKKAPSCELGLKILDPIVCHSFFHRIPHENNNMSWTVNPCNSSILRPSVFHSHLLIAILILLMPLYIQISWLGEYLNFHPLFEYIGLSPWKKIPWFSMACIPPNSIYRCILWQETMSDRLSSSVGSSEGKKYGQVTFIIYWFTGWWFGTFFIFHNIWDNPSHWLSYFSEGLKPPTSLCCFFFGVGWWVAKSGETWNKDLKPNRGACG